MKKGKRFFKKTIVALIVAATFAVLCMPVSLAAEYSGTTEGGFAWHFDESTGTMTVSGTGKMEEDMYYSWFVEDEDGTDGDLDPSIGINDMRPMIKKLIISEGITSVGHSAFQGLMSLECVELPNTVTEIGAFAFYFCKSLKSINIPDGVTVIKGRVFSFCESLTSIWLPDSLTELSNEAFDRTLTDIYFGGNKEEWKKFYGMDTYVEQNGIKVHYDSKASDLNIGGNSDSSVNNNDLSSKSYDVETTEKNSDGKNNSDSGSNGVVTVIIIVAVVAVVAGVVIVVMKNKKS